MATRKEPKMKKDISRKQQTVSPGKMTLKDVLEQPSDAIIEKVLPFSKKIFCKKDGLISIKDSPNRVFYYVEKGTIEVSYKAQETRDMNDQLLTNALL